MNRAPPHPQNGHGYGQPGLGATWYPGGQDDFYMPEVISPSPQRVMPEVPENMQDNLAHLEREARDPHRSHRNSPQQHDRARFPERTSSSQPRTHGPPLDHPSRRNHTSPAYHAPTYGQDTGYDTMDHPNFSPFPVLRNPPPNVPPTDEQREANLERARVAVLQSNDADMQLAWAQDALAYVEIAAQNEARLALIQPPRPQTPQVEHQLKFDAMSIVNFLADQHHPKAEFLRGTWLEFGKLGYRVDKKEAFRCYSRAAEKGYARAEYRIGMQFETSGEPEKAVRYYEKGVQLGDSASYYRLGMMILLGQHGQRQDYATGLEYIRLAAQTCDSNAAQGAYVYGMLLARELPQVSVPEHLLPLDLNGARINVEKAAYHGFAKAQVKMGGAYELCQLGCDFNPALSLHYNALAARQGEPEAEMAISKWFLCGHEGVFEKNDELAFKYAQRAAQSGLPTAEFALGYFYEVGIFVPSDLKEARSWYSKAAASGNKDATSRIESISRSKTLSKKDHEKVALARLRSRHGAHGANNSLDATPENLEMPDPSRMRISDHSGTSAAPYPDRGASRGRGQPGYPTNDGRSNSAFGINPNIRPGAAGQLPPGGHRVASGPGPMGYGRPPGPPSTAGSASPPIRSPPGTPRLDIGFSAPHDPSGRRPSPNMNYHGGAPPDRRSGRTPVSPHPHGGPMHGMPNSSRPLASPTTGQYPPRTESRPAGGPSPAPGGGRPSATPNFASTSASSQHQQRPAAQQAPPAKQPPKGPKTFEEMGVPAQKNDSDCIIM